MNADEFVSILYKIRGFMVDSLQEKPCPPHDYQILTEKYVIYCRGCGDIKKVP